MRVNFHHLSPARLLLWVFFLTIGVASLGIWYATQLSWFGLTLKPTEQSILVEFSQAPARSVPIGAEVIALISNGKRLDLHPTDLIDDPDSFDTYQQMNAFFIRQSLLNQYLKAPVEVVWRIANSHEKISTLTPQKRPLSSLPFVSWFSLLTGTLACWISCWVWSLRREDWGARMFAMTGMMFFVTVVLVMIYSSRPLAIDGKTFQLMSTVNHFTVFTFGGALVGLFLCYPRMLVKPRTLLWLPLIYGIWWLVDVMQLPPRIMWGIHTAVLSHMLLAIIFSFFQWQGCRTNPVERASLRWFVLSIIPAGVLTILPVLIYMLFGRISFLNPPAGIIYPGVGFGTALIMYLGIALGLSRHRLFELNDWAYRILLWVGSAVLVIVLDVVFIFLLKSDPAFSLGISMLVAGLLYFPLRQWLWMRYITPTHMRIEQAMPELIRIAFIDSLGVREQEWGKLLSAIYNPLKMVKLETAVSKAKLDNDGLDLYVPNCGELPARMMSYPQQGHRLFTMRDVEFVFALSQLMEHAASGRIAHEQGATQERRRISRDMHDDVGARLLMLIHRAKDEPTAEVARAAMRDLRTALNSLDAQSARLEDALADWRLEAETRCEAAGVILSWHEPLDPPEYRLSPLEKSALERVLREMLSNALRHASPTEILVETSYENETLLIAMSNEARAPIDWQEGRGIRNMRSRLAEIGGSLRILQMNQRNFVTIVLPIKKDGQPLKEGVA